MFFSSYVFSFYKKITEIQSDSTITNIMTKERIFEIIRIHHFSNSNDFEFECNNEGELTYLSVCDKNWPENCSLIDNLIDLISEFKALKYLYIDLEHYKITNVDTLKSLKHLESLYIYNETEITSLSFLDSVSSLTSICIENSEIKDISPLYRHTTLREITLKNAKITDVSGLYKLKQLTTLTLSNNHISRLGELPWSETIKSVNLANNKIKDLNVLKDCIYLSSLNVNSNLISNLDGLLYIRSFNSLNIGNNQIYNILDVFDGLKAVRYLNIENNPLKNIDFVKQCKRLITLNIAHNRVDNLSILENNRSLQKLNITGNSITDLSLLEKYSETLTHLNCSKNPIENLNVLPQLKRLIALDLSYFKLDFSKIEFPNSLIKLRLTHCSIQHLSELKSIENIRELDLSSNNIQQLNNKHISKNLKFLNLSDNNITIPILTISYLEIDLLDLSNNPFGNCIIYNDEYKTKDARNYIEKYYNRTPHDTDVAVSFPNFNLEAIKYCLQHNYLNEALGFHNQIRPYIISSDLEILELKIFVKKLLSTSHGEDLYITYYFYKTIESLIKLGHNSIYAYKNFISTHTIELIKDKLNTIQDLELKHSISVIYSNKNSFKKLYTMGESPLYNIMQKEAHLILPEFKEEYYFILGNRLSRYNMINHTQLKMVLYLLKQLHTLDSPFYIVLYLHLEHIFNSHNASINLSEEEFSTLKTTFINIEHTNITLPKEFNHKAFVQNNFKKKGRVKYYNRAVVPKDTATVKKPINKPKPISTRTTWQYGNDPVKEQTYIAFIFILIGVLYILGKAL